MDSIKFQNLSQFTSVNVTKPLKKCCTALPKVVMLLNSFFHMIYWIILIFFLHVLFHYSILDYHYRGTHFFYLLKINLRWSVFFLLIWFIEYWAWKYLIWHEKSFRDGCNKVFNFFSFIIHSGIKVRTTFSSFLLNLWDSSNWKTC